MIAIIITIIIWVIISADACFELLGLQLGPSPTTSRDGVPCDGLVS